MSHASRPSTSVKDENLWIFHHDKAPSHSSLIVTEFLAKRETKVIAQPPYSPDLAPWAFFLLPKLKYLLWGTLHESIEAIKGNSLKELKAIPAEAYKKCTENWIKARKEPILKAIIKICIKIHKNVFFFKPVGSNLIRSHIVQIQGEVPY